MKKIDVIIPFFRVTDTIIEQLYNSLLKQTIIKDCHIIFISDESPDELLVINQFKNSELDITFLRNDHRSGPGVARNLGLTKLKSTYCIFLDVDDYFYDNQSLENLYNLMDNKDIILFLSYCDIDHPPKINAIVRCRFIQEKDIKYPCYFMGETQSFQQKIFHAKGVRNLWLQNSVDQQYIVYGLKNNNIHLLQEIINRSNLIYNFCNAFPYLKLCFEIPDKNYIYNNIVRLLELYHTTTYNKVFLYYALFLLHQNFPDIFNKAIYSEHLMKINKDIKYKNELLLASYIEKNLYFELEDQILKTEEDILNYLYKFYNLYKNNLYAKPVLNDMLNLFLMEGKDYERN